MDAISELLTSPLFQALLTLFGLFLLGLLAGVVNLIRQERREARRERARLEEQARWARGRASVRVF